MTLQLQIKRPNHESSLMGLYGQLTFPVPIPDEEKRL